MIRKLFFLNLMVLTILSVACSSSVNDEDEVCTTKVSPNIDTLNVGDSLLLHNVISNYYIKEGKEYNISDKQILYKVIIKPLTDKNSIAGFSGIEASLDYDLIEKNINGNGLVFDLSTNNQGLGGYFKPENDSMYADVYIVFNKSGVYAIEEVSEPVITKKSLFREHIFTLHFLFDVPAEHNLNKEWIPDEELRNKYYIVFVK